MAERRLSGVRDNLESSESRWGGPARKGGSKTRDLGFGPSLHLHAKTPPWEPYKLCRLACLQILSFFSQPLLVDNYPHTNPPRREAGTGIAQIVSSWPQALAFLSRRPI